MTELLMCVICLSWPIVMMKVGAYVSKRVRDAEPVDTLY